MTICDNKSVGVLIHEGGRVLLIERKKPPFGFAPPAGHIDKFKSPEHAAYVEVQEEVGLRIESQKLIGEGRRNNPCRREGGDHHYWWIFQAEVSGEVEGSNQETKQVRWFTFEEIKKKMQRTDAYLKGQMTEDEWERNPGIEPVWCEWFAELHII